MVEGIASWARQIGTGILVMVAVLKFNDTDYHNLVDLLVAAVKVTEATGHRPSVVVHGRTYAPMTLLTSRPFFRITNRSTSAMRPW
jgi:hypothetical protein